MNDGKMAGVFVHGPLAALRTTRQQRLGRFAHERHDNRRRVLERLDLPADACDTHGLRRDREYMRLFTASNDDDENARARRCPAP